MIIEFEIISLKIIISLFLEKENMLKFNENIIKQMVWFSSLKYLQNTWNYPGLVKQHKDTLQATFPQSISIY